MSKIKNILLYLWQLPQNILGLIILLILKDWEECTLYNIDFYYYDAFPGAISLGNYIISGSKKENTVKHEYGHTIQSKMLGWLYLPIVGLYSILHAWLCKCKNHSYYDIWCEKWADNLGNVKRNK